jgi:hypothetical protein
MDPLCNSTSQCKPQLAPELFKYQAFITKTNQRFQPYAWLHATWLSADATKAKQPSFSCGSPDHLAPHCPLKAQVAAPLARGVQVVWELTSLAQVCRGWPPQQAEQICRYGYFAPRKQKDLLLYTRQIIGGLTNRALASGVLDILPWEQGAATGGVRSQVFAQFLASHPSKAFVSTLIHSCSLTNGFDIGYVGPHTQLTAPNLPSAYQYPSVVNKALQKEIAE